ncbi:RuBisCO operon transcriptional regulator [Rhodovastum atsumiense]|uniref:HTH-type transcriptional regulator CbbR n=1 Tax=Rhodovastum atsumiense TaxID=504468 RepID=A0A5M6ILC3_9PROT|nr:LysR family transcriptional regulator [Rhodovastum atsumiense]KAA5609076.1 LysR family transcriptional regulator [Rhodovastum atsumiense]CAH2602170.1 RuBisCO operon transcriptional regulator [Rhodovastum atsumiense]
MHLTLQQLRLFEAVARHRHFTRAAEELHLTQQAVSIQLRRLEENAGAKLFEHIGRRFFLTPAGHEMHAACADILARLQALEESLDALGDTMKGPLRLSVVTTAKYFIPHLLGAFIAGHQAVVPRLIVTNRARVVERLADNQDDFVIMGQVPTHLAIETCPFLENRLVVAAHPDHPLAGMPAIPPALIAGERWLVREAGSGTRTAFDQHMAGQGVAIAPYMELGSTEAIKQAVIAGLGLSVLPLASMELELSCGCLVVLDVDGFSLCRRWNAVWLKGKTLPRVARAFLGFLQGVAAGRSAGPTARRD